MNRKTTLSIAALAFALLGTVAVARTALAHGPGGRGGAGGMGLAGLAGHGMGHAGGQDERGELLAAELGVTVDELQAARLRAFEKGIAAAVKAGNLTQDKADLMLAGAKLAAAIDHDAITAEALGISVADLTAAREAGKTIRDLLTEQNLDAQTFHTQMQAAMDKAISKAVADGVITQAQADALKAAKGERGGAHGRRGGMPGGQRGGMPGGQRGGRGGFGGPGMGDDANGTAPVSPTSNDA